MKLKNFISFKRDIFTKFTSSRQQQPQAAATATWPEHLEWITTDSGGGKQRKEVQVRL